MNDDFARRAVAIDRQPRDPFAIRRGPGAEHQRVLDVRPVADGAAIDRADNIADAEPGGGGGALKK